MMVYEVLRQPRVDLRHIVPASRSWRQTRQRETIHLPASPLGKMDQEGRTGEGEIRMNISHAGYKGSSALCPGRHASACEIHYITLGSSAHGMISIVGWVDELSRHASRSLHSDSDHWALVRRGPMNLWRSPFGEKQLTGSLPAIELEAVEIVGEECVYIFCHRIAIGTGQASRWTFRRPSAKRRSPSYPSVIAVAAAERYRKGPVRRAIGASDNSWSSAPSKVQVGCAPWFRILFWP